MFTSVRIAVAIASFAAGLYLGARGRDRVINNLSKFLVHFVIPVLIAYSIILTEFSRMSGIFMVGLSYAIIGLIATATLFLKVMKVGRGDSGAAIYASYFQNIVFLPVPLMTILYGDPTPALIYASAYSLVNPVAIPLIKEHLLGSGLKLSGSVRALLTFPPSVAFFASMAVKLALGTPELPHELMVLRGVINEFNLISFSVVGHSLGRSGKLVLDRVVASVVAWRLIASPAIHLALLTLVPLQGVWLAAALIQSVMPPSTSSVIYSRFFGFRDSIASTAIAVSTPISLATSVIIRLLIPPT